MRKILTTLYCSLCLIGFAQKKYTDSLQNLIRLDKDDSNKVIRLMTLANALYFSHPDSAHFYANQSLQLAQRLRDPKLEAKALAIQGASTLFTGNLPLALDITLKSLSLSERIQSPSDIYTAVTTLGNIYYYQKDFRKALEYFLRSLDIAHQTHNEAWVAQSEEDIGNDYSKLNILDSAIFYTNLALQKTAKLPNNYALADELNNLGDTYVKMNKGVLALAYYRQALSVEGIMEDAGNFSQATIGIATIFEKNSKHDSALYYAYQAMASTESSNLTLFKVDACSFIGSLYETMGKSDSALKYLKLTIVLKDSLFSEEGSKSIQNLTYEENQRQLDRADRAKKDQENRAKTLQLVAVAVFIPIFFMFIIFLSRTKVKARVVEFLGVVGLLLAFEFITDLVFPFISDWTNDSPLWEMLILVIIAALLEPVNYKVEHWIKVKLVRKTIRDPHFP